MEDSLAYNFEIRIESGTKRLILDMIRSIHSVIPADTDMEIEETNLSVRTDKLNTYVEEVISLTEEHPEILSGIFDIKELKAYLKYSQDYQDITNQLQDLLDKLKQHHEKTNFLTIQLASSIREHLDLVAPDFYDPGILQMMSVIHKKYTGKISPGTNDLKVVS